MSTANDITATPTRPTFMKKIRESEVSQHAPPAEPVIPLIPKPKKVKVPPSIMTEEKVETFGSWFMGNKSTPAPISASTLSATSTLQEPPPPPPPLELERPPKAEPTESLNEAAMVATLQGEMNKGGSRDVDSNEQQHEGPEGPASPSPSFTSPRSQFLVEREALFSLPSTRSAPLSTSPKKRLDLNLLARNEKTHKKEWLEKLKPAPPKENITGRCIYSMRPNERDLLFAPPLLKSTI